MNTTVKKKHSVFKTILIIVLILIILALITTIVCTILAFQDPYKDKYSTKDTVTVDSHLITDIAKSAAFGKEYIASDEEINSYIRKVLNSKESSNLKDLAVYFHDNKCAEVYGRINFDIREFNYNGDLGFYADADFSINSEQKTLDIALSNAKIGLLPVPNFVLENIIHKTLKDKVKYDKTTISLPVSLDTTIEDIELRLNLEEFTPNENSVTIKSNKVLADTLDSATERAKEWIAEHHGELKEYGDDIDQWLDENRNRLPEYESKAEEWVNNNSDTISEYTDKAKEWLDNNSETVSEYTDKAREWFQNHAN